MSTHEDLRPDDEGNTGKLWCGRYFVRGADVYDALSMIKESDYLRQENAVLHEKLRKLEIKLAAEREACAKVADKEEGKASLGEQGAGTGEDTAYYRGCADTANSIAALIRGRA